MTRNTHGQYASLMRSKYHKYFLRFLIRAHQFYSMKSSKIKVCEYSGTSL